MASATRAVASQRSVRRISPALKGARKRHKSRYFGIIWRTMSLGRMPISACLILRSIWPELHTGSRVVHRAGISALAGKDPFFITNQTLDSSTMPGALQRRLSSWLVMQEGLATAAPELMLHDGVRVSARKENYFCDLSVSRSLQGLRRAAPSEWALKPLGLPERRRPFCLAVRPRERTCLYLWRRAFRAWPRRAWNSRCWHSRRGSRSRLFLSRLRSGLQCTWASRSSCATQKLAARDESLLRCPW